MQDQKVSYTPGPWIVVKHSTKYPDLFTYNVEAPRGWQEDDGTYCICAVVSDLDSDADARLIAAAPDLLEAAKQAATSLSDRHRDFEENNGEWSYGDRAVLLTLRAAIDKAEGR